MSYTETGTFEAARKSSLVLCSIALSILCKQVILEPVLDHNALSGLCNNMTVIGAITWHTFQMATVIIIADITTV